MFATKSYVASDPEEFASLIRGARVEVVASERGGLTRVRRGSTLATSGCRGGERV